MVLIRRPSDLTPVLEELSKFNVINSSDILDWEKKIESNGLCITIQPTELYGFDWDLTMMEMKKRIRPLKKYI